MPLYYAPTSIRTKAQLRAQLKSAYTDLVFDDAALSRPRGLRPSEMRTNQHIVVTNHPRRSWFARITCTSTNPCRFKVK